MAFKENQNWEESESLKIFGIAQKYLLQENNKGALKEFSEILEFFPNANIWPKTCLEIFYIHLGSNRNDNAKQILTRLLERKNLPSELNMDILFAQWDYYSQTKAQSELNSWINERNPKDKKTLRTSPAFLKRFKQSLKNSKTSFAKSIELWVSLEPPRPMESFINLHQPEKGFAFGREQVKIILTKLLTDTSSNFNIHLISQVMNIMGKNGWASDAHQCFSLAKQRPELFKVWIRFLLKHQLYLEASETITKVISVQKEDSTKKPKGQDFSLEFIEAHIGLRQWNLAAASVKTQGNWVFSSLAYPVTLQLFKGLQQQAHLQIQMEDLYQMLNPNLKTMIQVELEENQEKKELKLMALLEKNSLYSKRAAEILNSMYMIQRDKKKLTSLLNKFQNSHPNAKNILSAIKKSIRTLEQLQPSKPSNNRDIDKK